MRVLMLADLGTVHSIRWFDALAEHFEVAALSLETPAERREGFIEVRTHIQSKRWKYVLNLARVRAAVPGTPVVAGSPGYHRARGRPSMPSMRKKRAS